MRSAPVRILALGSLAVMMLVALACDSDSEPATAAPVERTATVPADAVQPKPTAIPTDLAPVAPVEEPATVPADAAEPKPTAIPTDLPPFVIGVMECITGISDTFGRGAVQAKTMAADEINAAGGVNGRRLELVVEDSQCRADDAILAYNKLTDVDGVKIILGMTSSEGMVGVAPLAESDDVILFSGVSRSNADYAYDGDYIFSSQISDVQAPINTGNVLWADGVRKLATITDNFDHTEDFRRTSVEQFEKRGGAVVAAEEHRDNVSNSWTQLTKLLAAGPDGLLVVSFWDTGTIIKQARQQGYEGPIYADGGWLGSDALNTAGEAATGMRVITTDLGPDNRTTQEVLANFSEHYPSATLPWYLSWYLGSAYDNVYIAAECLKRTNDDQDANGEVVGVSSVVGEILPVAERTEERPYKALGTALGWVGGEVEPDGGEVETDGGAVETDTEGIETDRAALVTLYYATDGPNWPNWEDAGNWLSDKPLEEWEGVSTICQLSLHHCHEAKARGMATSNSPRHSAHGP